MSPATEPDLDRLAPVLPWELFVTRVFDWRQGEHVGLIGPTESGKSTLTYAILPARDYVTFFATKPRDETLTAFARDAGYAKIADWPPRARRGWRGFMGRPATPREMPLRLLWPDARQLGAVEHQKQVFRKAFEDIYSSGGWTVVWDEFWMMTRILGLEEESRIFLQQARSNDISFVMGAQRPSRIPLEMFDQSRHLFFWRDNDERNLKNISGIGWLAAKPIMHLVANLEPHQVLYINTRSGVMYRTKAPAVAVAAKRK